MVLHWGQSIGNRCVGDAMADAAPDDGASPNDWNPGAVLAIMEGYAVNVSVTSLGGEVLATVSVSGRASIWELKGLIHSHGLGRSAKFIETTLLLDTQVLADAASLRDVGVVDGTMLSVIFAPKYSQVRRMLRKFSCFCYDLYAALQYLTTGKKGRVRPTHFLSMVCEVSAAVRASVAHTFSTFCCSLI
jgi:hypothetical protein